MVHFRSGLRAKHEAASLWEQRVDMERKSVGSWLYLDQNAYIENECSFKLRLELVSGRMGSETRDRSLGWKFQNCDGS